MVVLSLLLKIKVLIKNLCPCSDLKQAFNQFYDNRPKIQLFNQNESAAIIHQLCTDEKFGIFNCPRIESKYGDKPTTTPKPTK